MYQTFSVREAAMQVTLVYFKPDGSRKEVVLDKPGIVVGRRPDCDVRVPQPGVSRRHCELVVRDDTLVVRDLGSSNGTYVNGTRVGEEAAVEPGTRLQVGPVILTVRIDGQPAEVKPPRVAKPAAKTAAGKASAAAAADADVDEEDIFAQMMMEDDDDDEADDSLDALEMLEDDDT